MSPDLKTGELTKTMNLLVKSGINLCGADIHFLKYCRALGWGKLTGVLIKDGIPVMADIERRDIRFDVKTGT